MDRRSFLGLFGGLAAAATLLKASPSEAMPTVRPADAASPTPEPAVATDADMEGVRTEQAGWRRRRRWRRRGYRRYYRRRFYRRRYYRRRFRRRYYRPVYYYRRPRVYYYRWW